VVVTTRGSREFLVIVEDDGPGFGRVPTHNGIGLQVARRVLTGLGGGLAIGRSDELGGARVAFGVPSVLRAVPLPRGAEHDRLIGPGR
jgi:two-component sensor histidine kinase